MLEDAFGTPYWGRIYARLRVRTAENTHSTTFVNKVKKMKGRSLISSPGPTLAALVLFVYALPVSLRSISSMRVERFLLRSS